MQLNNKNFGLAFQALIFVILVAVCSYLAFNLIGNLGARSIHTGFGFLWSAAVE